jgi:hypothetical protein
MLRSREKMSGNARMERPEELKRRPMDGLEEQSDEPVATKNGAIEEEGCVLLPCADLTCPCRVMKRQMGKPSER